MFAQSAVELETHFRAILNQVRRAAPVSRLASFTFIFCFVALALALAIPRFTSTPTPAALVPVGAIPESTFEFQPPAEPPQPALGIEESISPNELIGLVVDSDGNPIPDAIVDAWSWAPGDETKTDAAGRFRLKLDDRTKIELRIMKEGYSPFYEVQQDLGVSNFKVVLTSKCFIEGTVRDSKGRPVPHIDVRGQQGPKQGDGVLISAVETKTSTDENGKYRLYVFPDTYELLVRTQHGEVAKVSHLTVAVNEARKQDIELSQGITFEAKVIDSLTGKPFPDLVLSHFMHPGVVGVSDAQGRLVIKGMFPGKFEFEVGEGESQRMGTFLLYLPRTIGRWWSPQATGSLQREMLSTVQFQRNLDDLTFDMQMGMKPVTIYAEPGVTFSGRVTDPDGRPVEGATVAPAKSGSGNSLTGDTRYSVRTDKNGNYRVVMPAGKNFAYNLIAHDGDYQEWRNWANGVSDLLHTLPGDEVELDLKLTRPAVVRGRVVSKENQPVGGIQVRAHAKDFLENRYYDPTTSTNPDGTFELKFIRPGQHFIQVEPFWEPGNAPIGNAVVVSLEPRQIKDNVELTTGNAP